MSPPKKVYMTLRGDRADVRTYHEENTDVFTHTSKCGKPDLSYFCHIQSLIIYKLAEQFTCVAVGSEKCEVQ